LRHRLTILAVVIACSLACWAKGDALLPVPANFGKLSIPRVATPPPLEAFLDMKPSAAWEGKLAKADHFLQRVPHDGEPSSQATETYFGYDDKNFYAIFICFDNEPGKIRARLSRREDIWDDEFVELLLDTFHDRRRAYGFFSNPLGVQADGIWTEGQDWDFSFDTIFDTQAKVTDRGFVVRMAIPFRSLRFAGSDPQSWGILLARDIPRNNEKVFWPQYSSRIAGRLNQAGEASGMQDISSGRNLQLIPHGVLRAYQEPDQRDPYNPVISQCNLCGQLGLDGKAVLKDKFVLDATANPDFSQIESDDPQVTVNQRFQVFFPEKRPFFLENANYFTTPINLVFTRRIADPKWGVRMTGKDGPWALGMMVADDRSPGESVPVTDPLAGKSALFAIGRVSYDLGKQSTIGALYTDRELEQYYNRVGGLDGHFTLNSHWTANAQAVVSSTINPPDDTFLTTGQYQAGNAAEAVLQRQGLKLNYLADYSNRSNDFRTLTGFDPQDDIQNIYQNLRYTLHPESKLLISWGPQFENYYTFDHQGNELNWGYFPTMRFEFPGQTMLSASYAWEMELLRPQDYSSLTSNHQYTRHTTVFSLDTSYYKPVSLHVETRFGTRINYDSPTGQIPFLADRLSVNTTLTIRPTRSLKVDNTYILFRLHNREGSPPGSMNNHIIRSKWNYQFTRALSARFIGEYDAVLANPSFTSLQTTKNFNVDFLITYLVHPNTALYVGYNTNLANVLLPLGADSNGDLLRGPNMINDARNFFVKASYLFRF
jgi:predicted porin